MTRKKDKVKPNEFRHNKARSGHPAYIVKVYAETPKPPETKPKRKAKFIGLTEKAETHGEKNIPLHKNPDPKNPKKPAHIRPSVDEVELTNKTFGKKLQGWKFDDRDKPTIRIVIEKDNKKR